jgi:hypothetical protein
VEGGEAGGDEGRSGDDDEEGSRPDELRSAPLQAPRWAPNVMVSSRHMLRGS